MNTVIIRVSVNRNQLIKSKPIKSKDFYECLKMGNGATARMHFVFWSDFAINSLQTYTVKIFENYYNNSQGHC